MTSGTRAWLALAALLALLAAALNGLPRTALDWQPALALVEPWRAFTAVGVHYSPLHLGVNLGGVALLGLFGASLRPPMAFAGAWAAAWPLTQVGLSLRPDLSHYGGLSGVLHAGAAILAVRLLAEAPGRHRAVGAALLLGLAAKVVSEAPWGPALRHPPGWDIAIAPLAHATGLLAGLGCGLVATAWSFRHPSHAHA